MPLESLFLTSVIENICAQSVFSCSSHWTHSAATGKSTQARTLKYTPHTFTHSDTLKQTRTQRQALFSLFFDCRFSPRQRRSAGRCATRCCGLPSPLRSLVIVHTWNSPEACSVFLWRWRRSRCSQPFFFLPFFSFDVILQKQAEETHYCCILNGYSQLHCFKTQSIFFHQFSFSDVLHQLWKRVWGNYLKLIAKPHSLSNCRYNCWFFLAELVCS